MHVLLVLSVTSTFAFMSSVRIVVDAITELKLLASTVFGETVACYIMHHLVRMSSIFLAIGVLGF